jgi:hypothetical protein
MNPTRDHTRYLSRHQSSLDLTSLTLAMLLRQRTIPHPLSNASALTMANSIDSVDEEEDSNVEKSEEDMSDKDDRVPNRDRISKLSDKRQICFRANTTRGELCKLMAMTGSKFCRFHQNSRLYFSK